MLASFFKKSKPINFLIVGVFMTIYFISANFFRLDEAFSWPLIAEKTGYLIIYLLLMFILNFIVKRNGISKKNSFAILLFGLLTMLLLPVLKASEILVSAFFVLLALRKIISLKSGLEIKKKIFDASMWIAVASLFYPLSLFFLILPFVSIFYYATQDFKNFLIPFVALICTYLLVTAGYLLVLDITFPLSQFLVIPDLNIAIYQEAYVLIPLIIITLFTLISLFFFLKEMQNTIRKRKAMLFLILLFFIIGLLIVVLAPQKTGAELLFPMLGISMMGVIFLEEKGLKLIKEIALAILILAVLIIPFMLW
ncbi:DUF6427 family protein [Mesonia sp. MT50]|uniref:DUF6427 family protein n=1 Tax=Mesonia profundi TaxID=3070998 RepID=A0ABU0ZYK9_9FLAO|nr:DUF6427 family protein [Mesonia profundi]MDQ7916553.1 DUF6427 family protein [Mesonia profundi]